MDQCPWSSRVYQGKHRSAYFDQQYVDNNRSFSSGIHNSNKPLPGQKPFKEPSAIRKLKSSIWIFIVLDLPQQVWNSFLVFLYISHLSFAFNFLFHLPCQRCSILNNHYNKQQKVFFEAHQDRANYLLSVLHEFGISRQQRAQMCKWSCGH